MSTENPNADPLEFLKGMWGSMGFAVPGMVTPTLDVNEIDKRITDLKTVEGWLRMNLNMLQMSIQGLEMQRATLATLASMAQAATGPESEGKPNPFANSSMWPWNFMQTAVSPPPATKAPEGDASGSPARSSPKRKPKG